MTTDQLFHRTWAAQNLLDQLRQRDIVLSLHANGNDLCFDAPAGTFDDALKRRTRELKTEIIGLLRPPAVEPENNDTAGPILSSFPAHPAIEGQWIARRDQEPNANYHIITGFMLPEGTDFQAVQSAIAGIVKRHDALRSTFVEHDGQLIQRIHATMPVQVRKIDTPHDIRCALFDLATGPLARFGYIDHKDGQAPQLAIAIDHLCFDGQSIMLLKKELLAVLAGQKPGNVPDTGTIIRNAHYELDHERGDVARRFWSARTDKLLSVGLPDDPDADRKGAGKRLLIELTGKNADAFSKLAQYTRKTTQTALWMALTIAVIARHKENATAVIGLPFAGRRDRETMQAMGCFVNVLPVAIKPDMTASLETLTHQVAREVLSILDVQDYPLSRLTHDLMQITQGPTGQPFDAVNVMEISGSTFELEDIDFGAGKFPLMIGMMQNGPKTFLAVEYQSHIYSDAWIERCAQRFLTFAKALADNPEMPLGLVDLVPEDERNHLTVGLNDTASDYPRDCGVGELLSRQIADPSNTDKIALEDHNRKITYPMLGQQVAAISAQLEALGVTAGSIVALAADRSLDAIITILGIAWHGAAYLPIDKSLPGDAVAALMQECGAGILLCDTKQFDRLADLSDRVHVAGLPDMTAPSDAPFTKRAGDDLAYVMFTSGSTGAPKGVLIPNRAVARLVMNNRSLAFDNSLVMAQAASLGFDAATLEIWAPLLNGGRLVLIDDETLFDPSALHTALKNGGVTTMWLTASLFNRIADDAPHCFASLKTLLSGGEALSPTHLQKVMKACPDLALINGYGPTENTTFTCTHPITPDDARAASIPIGKPVGNTRIYILDERGQPVPTGVWGELYAAGDGLALGYSGAPERTARAFVTFDHLPETRLYKTGDRARWRADGVIEFGGRGDGQVKIRGHRIETSAIEKQLGEIEGIRNAYVMAVGSGADAFLGAAIASDRDNSIAWMQALGDKLPDYMIPERFVVLDHLPVNVNGKIDRKQLIAALTHSVQRAHPYAPTSNTISSDLEQVVAGHFRALFGKKDITTSSDFFVLGGHSLVAMRLAGLLEKSTGIRPKLQDIFIASTVGKIAALLGNARQEGAQFLIPKANGPKFALSSGQARLWVLQRMQPDMAVYSVPAAFEITGPIDANALQAALHQLEERQHALRLRFKFDPHHPDGVSQYLVPAGSWVLGRHEMDEGRARLFIARETVRPFDLDDKPLARADLITLGPNRHWMLVSLHHAICDGWSMPILLRDLAALYAAQTGAAAPPSLPVLNRHYEDFANWQRGYLNSAEGRNLLDRWKNRLYPLPEPLNLPTDRRRPKIRRFAGDFYETVFDNDTAWRIHDAANRHGTTAFSVLSALVQVLMYRHCGQTDIPLGMLVAGREQTALDDVVGFFVNTVVLRQAIDPDAGFDDHLAQTTKTVIDALADQAAPFEDVVAAVNAPRDPARNPLFDVLVAWQDSIPDLGTLGGAELSLLKTEFPFSKFDLAFYFSKRNDTVVCQIEFDTDLFDKSTIEAIFNRLETLANAALLAGSTTKIARLPILPAREQARIDQFNATDLDLAIERCISEPFIDQVRATPNAPAVIGTSATLSYAQFARRVAGIAAKLRTASVGPGDVIGVALRRSIDMLAAIHGILLAGAAYSPLDPDHPEQRRRDMLDDLGYPRVITTPDLAHLFDADKILILDGNEDADIPDAINAPDSLAYVLFTSGSTGRPKGVEIAHRGVLNRILWMQDAFPIGPDDVILQKTPITFDVSVWELFWWSWTGARVVLPDPGVERDPQQLAQAICSHNVTIIHFVPSMLASFLYAIEHGLVDIEKLGSLKRVFASGEALDPALVHRFNTLLFDRFGTELHNLYGPTEATVDVTWHACSPLDNPDIVPIGKPIANTRIRILDDTLQDMPIGIAGEIVLGGPQIARGYRNRPDLTAEKFPDDPGNPGQKLYRTGDLGRWLADGSVEYLGRMDHQVKIRGFRIECGEVETAIESHSLVERAVVKVVRIGGLDELHVFVLGDNDLTTGILRDHLRTRLPEYMIPARFFALDDLPLTSSGKVDRKALSGSPMPQSPKGSRAKSKPDIAIAPEAEPAGLANLEKILQRLWQEILPGVIANRDDGFFDIGGNSLLLLRLHEKINARWPGKVSIADLFASATIARQAELLAGRDIPTDNLAPAPVSQLATTEPIAVIGIGLRLPGADDLDTFWADAANGTDHVRPLPIERDQETREIMSAIGRQVPTHFREAAYLDHIFDFDPGRFRMAPADAALIDPEQRLFIETALMAMENAGYGGQSLRGQKVGIFAGGGANPAWRIAMEHVARDRAEQVFALNVPSNMVTRLSFLKDWHGPANIVDTACSSSLVAVHQACQNLRSGLCHIALAGGAKLIPFPPDAEGGFTIDSSTARTRAFDDKADGTGMGEGSVVFVLKPLGRALADGDTVHAVIRGSAVNQDGASSGAAAPNPAMQADVIRQAAHAADIELGSLSYIEAHGTGTSLGDPIEIDGLTRAFAGSTDETGFALIGSGKGNYGHLDGAAGALGLARAIMALRHDQAPPQPFFEIPNSRIDFARAPVRPTNRLEPLADRGAPRRAGVSSFGLSGINAHVILETAPKRAANAPDDVAHNGGFILALSAASDATLTDYATKLHRAVADNPGLDVRDICHTLATGRDQLKHRFAVAVSDRDSLLNALAGLIAGDRANCAEPKPATDALSVPAASGNLDGAAANARQWLAGANLVWPQDIPAQRVALPHAPFAKIVCKPAFRPRPASHTAVMTGPVETEKGRCFAIPVNSPSFWPTQEHHLNGQPTLVGMAVPALIAMAARNATGTPPVRISDLKWQKPLLPNALPDGTATLVLANDGRAELGGRLKNGKWSVFTTARWSRDVQGKDTPDPLLSLDHVRANCPLQANIAPFAKDVGPITISDRWDCRVSMSYSADETVAVSHLVLKPQYQSDLCEWIIHPAMVDIGCSMILTPDDHGTVPVAIDDMTIHAPFTGSVIVCAERCHPGQVNLAFFDADSERLLLSIKGIRFSRDNEHKTLSSVPELLSIDWVPYTPDIRPVPENTLMISDGDFWPVLPACLRISPDAMHTRGKDMLATAQNVILALQPGTDMALRTARCLRMILRSMRGRVRLVVAGCGAYQIGADSIPPDPDQSAAAGVAIAVGAEEPRLVLDFADIAPEDFVDHIGTRFASAPDRDRVSMYRQKAWYRRKLRPVSRDERLTQATWPDHGVCVVTGGTGGFALALAEEMAANGKLALALLSRRGEDGLDSTARSRLAELHAKGIRISLFACDVADKAALSRTLATIRDTLGPITAIAHAAGLADGGFLAVRDMDAFESIMAAKIDGARHLDALTIHDPVAAFVMFGSLTAIVGVPGQAAYSAANAFLDGFARYRRSQGRPALTIDWCALDEQGMAARHKVPLQEGATITPRQAPIIWRDAMRSTAPQLVVLAPSLAGETPDRPAKPVSAAAPEVTGLHTTPAMDIDQKIATIWAETLGYDAIARDDDFFALGGDSITGMQIVDRMNAELEMTLSISDLFETPTVDALCGRFGTAPMPGSDNTEPAGHGDTIPTVKPRSTGEEIAKIWAEILGYERIDPEEDFFALGGDSITGMQIIDRMNNDLACNISLADLFETPTVTALGTKLLPSGKTTETGLSPVSSPARTETEEDPRQTPETEFYPLAPEQISVLHAEQSGTMGTAFNLPHAFILDGSVNPDRLRDAITELTKRHDILRTRLIARGDDWVMKILPLHEALPDLTMIELDAPVSLEDACAGLVTPFDLTTEIPARWRVICTATGKKALFFDIHHTVSDGFTIEMLLGELLALYRGQTLPPLRYQLRDYACWSQQPENLERLEKARDYWLSLYQGPLPKLDLPSDRRRPAVHSFKGDIIGFELDPALLKSARKFASDQRVTMFSLMMATWFAVLGRITETRDLVISVPVNQRDGTGFGNVPGMMVSLLPLRMKIADDETFASLLHKVQNHHIDALRHRAYFLDLLLGDLSPPASPERTLLSEVSLSYMNYAQGDYGTADQTGGLRPIGLGRQHCKNDLAIFVRDLPERMTISFDYYADMFDQARMVELGHIFTTTLQNLVAAPATAKPKPIVDLDLLPEDQRAKIESWEKGPQPHIDLDHRAQSGLFSIFAQQASKTADARAIRDTSGTWTFAELQANALSIAHYLKTAGVAPGDLVAVHIERGRPAIAAILGITAVGAGYVPLDPAYPVVRNQFILSDSGAKLVLVDDAGYNALGSLAENGDPIAKRINIAGISPAPADFALPPLATPDSLPAYMMYTSGSTGTPKGVLIEQGAVRRLALGADYANIHAGDVVAQAGPLAFDAATFEIWATLLGGAEIAVIDREDLLDPAKLGQALLQSGVTKMFMSAGLFNRQIDHDPRTLGNLDILMVGGDAISKRHIRTFLSACPDVTVLNGYGPTETTTFAVVGPITEEDLSGDTDSTIIGKPIAFTKTQIRDRNGQRVPVGVWGELMIGGKRLAREYWNRPDLTREKFVPDPDHSGKRLYRTGDLARWTRDGRIEFGGRHDNQIKLRGFRIELDEIEQQLQSAPDIGNAVVLFDAAAPDGGAIIGCLQPATSSNGTTRKFDVAALMAWLGETLPGYMIPAKWHIVDTIPITANGKVDRRALLETARNQSDIMPLATGEQTDTPPANEAEKQITEIFTEVFATSIHNRFASFAQLGGHSLMAIRIVNRIADRTGIRISMADFFADPTVAGLARHIDETATDRKAVRTEQIPPAPAMDYYPASHAQKRLYLLSQMEGNKGAYGMLYVFRCTADLQTDILQSALMRLVDRHETLRTGFVEHDGAITQKIHATTPPAVAFDDVSGHDDPVREALRLTRIEATTPIILDQPPLIRARVIEVTDTESLMILMSHHIVGDGWSSRILVNELGSHYDAVLHQRDDPLPALPITYKDFAYWQSRQDWSEATNYWRQQLANAPEQINLPTDRPVPEKQSFRGAHAHLALPDDVLAGLYRLARQNRTTLSSVGMALFSAMLYRLTRQRDMVIGMGVAGRERTETEGLIGFFVNVLPIRMQLDDDTDLGELIRTTHGTIANALDRQDFPFDELVRAVAPKRNSNRQPLVNVVFEYQRFEAVAAVKQTGLPLLPADTPGILPANMDDFVDNTTAKHDIILFLTEEAGQARFTLEYDTDLFDAETMQRWLSFLGKFAASAAQNAQRDDT
ncbi:non-ribosomal peptide synthetase [Thalassospira profundimaris]|uniref:non-ribosomal peptide synthetase n=1 Tax=Thalassospira profundimaris TaxID=502049 RepID=UPI000DED63EB|nr:non-ribosomal peptide synthetase [Thalassospira profundimaris]